HRVNWRSTTENAPDCVLVATINGSYYFSAVTNVAALTGQEYNGTTIWLSSSGRSACAIDGQFLLIGDETGVKSALDTRKAATGIDKSARYQAARGQLGLDRLATLYVDGTALAKAMPTTAPNPATDLASLLP